LSDAKISALTELTTPAGADLLAIVDDTDSTTKKITLENLLDYIYPVGSVYISVSSTSPATLFGGTWSAFGAGKTLVGIDAGDAAFDTVEETGGAKTVTLTSAQSGLPAHNHPAPPGQFLLGGGEEAALVAGTGVSSAINTNSNTAANAAESHTNLQPYIVTYMFKRTA
jgi:hypothetical protein